MRGDMPEYRLTGLITSEPHVMTKYHPHREEVQPLPPVCAANRQPVIRPEMHVCNVVFSVGALRDMSGAVERTTKHAKERIKTAKDAMREVSEAAPGRVK